MHTIQDIKDAISRLAPGDRAAIAAWINDSTPGGLRVEEPAVAYDLTPALSVDEYLALERDSPLRHEYVAGVLRTMTGCSQSHNEISLNLAMELRNHLRGGSCRTFMAEIKVRLQVGQADFAYYPDVMVSCEPEMESRYFLRRPRLVIEVLSPSTRAVDLREKLANYRHIAALQEYAVVEQDRADIRIYRRTEDWHPQQFSGLEAVAEFHSVGLSLPLGQVYEGVALASSLPGAPR